MASFSLLSFEMDVAPRALSMRRRANKSEREDGTMFRQKKMVRGRAIRLHELRSNNGTRKRRGGRGRKTMFQTLRSILNPAAVAVALGGHTMHLLGMLHAHWSMSRGRLHRRKHNRDRKTSGKDDGLNLCGNTGHNEPHSMLFS